MASGRGGKRRKAKAGTKDQKRMFLRSEATLARNIAKMDQPPRAKRGCTGKKRYPKKTLAEQAIGRTKRIEIDGKEGRLNAYHCKDGCGGWHVGHTTRK